CGGNNGQITVTAFGRNIEFTKDGGATWQSSHIFSGLEAGYYDIGVRNTDGTCESYSSFNPVYLSAVGQPLVSSVVPANPISCGGNDGQITVVAANGNSSGFEYSSDSGSTWQTSNVLTGLSAGDYSVFIRNGDGTCVSPYYFNPVSLTPPNPPSITGTVKTDVTNCGSSDGAITINVSGDPTNFEYSKDSGATWQASPTFSNLIAGNYFVYIRNSNASCATPLAGNPVVINSPTTPVIASTTTVNPTDCNLSDGEITLTVTSGNTSNYEYSIDGGSSWQTTNTFLGLSSGTYTAQVRNEDSTCLVTTNNIVLVAPEVPNFVTTVPINPTDCNASDGSIFVIGTGTSIEYSIDSGATWQANLQFNGLPAGTYHAAIRNTNGTCFVVSPLNPIILIEPAAPQVNNVTFTNITDCNINDGTITITANGGTAPLQYSIDGGSTWQANNTFTNLDAGSYATAVRNANSTCMATGEIIPLLEPASPNISSIIAANISNCTTDDGSITITGVGGIGVYEYSIDNGNTWQSSNYFSNLSAGNYNVNIRNNDTTCIISHAGNPVVISEPNAPTLTNSTYTDPTNCGVIDGTITLTASGGSGSYEYSIDNGVTWINSAVFTNLTGGIYNIFIRNSNGTCATSVGTITLTDKPSPSFSSVIGTNTTDCGVSDGSIVVIGNISNLEYSSDSGLTWQSSGIFSNLSSGNYNLVVRNLDGTCMTFYPSNPMAVNEPNTPTINDVNFSSTTNCATNDGSITITALGGIAPLQYSIDSGITWQANNTFTNLSAGTYSLWVKNANGSCLIMDNPLTLTEPNTPIIDAVTANNPTDCINPNGTITIAASGGSGSYEYSIDNGTTWQVTGTFTDLTDGTYTVLVRNDDGTCSVTSLTNPIVLIAPVSPQGIATSAVQPTNCGISDGLIFITTNTTGSFEYSIDSGTTWQSTSSFSGLSSGTYFIFVRNADGSCEIDGGSIDLIEPNAPQFTQIITANLTNCGTTDGSIILIANISNVEYSIDSGMTWQNTGVFQSLASGMYYATIRNADSTCQVFDVANPIQINAPNQAIITNITPTNPANCNVNDGSIVIGTTGGVAPLQYSIDGGLTWQNSLAFTGLSEGVYHIRVRNSGGSCIVDGGQVTLIAPASPLITGVNHSDPTDCSNNDGTITITATAGSSNIEYSIDGGGVWSASNIFTGLSGGTYNVFVRNDDNTCIVNWVNNSIILTTPTAPIISNITTTDITDCGANDGTVTVVMSGAGTYEYSKDNGSTWQLSNVFTNLAPNTYQISVRNSDGSCTVNGSVATIQDIFTPIINNVTVSTAGCNGIGGTLTVTAVGTDTTLQYSIDGGATWQADSVFNNVAAGNYNISVRYITGVCFENYSGNTVNVPTNVAGINLLSDTTFIDADHNTNIVDICLPIILSTIMDYEIYIDNQIYTGAIANCGGNTKISINNTSSSIIVNSLLQGCADTSVLSIQFNPVAVQDMNMTFENEAVDGNVLTNDIALRAGSTLGVTLLSATTNGAINLQSNGDYTYTPNNNYIGVDEFTYILCDNFGFCDIAKNRIRVLENDTNQVTLVYANVDYSVGKEGKVILGSVLNNDIHLQNETLQATTINLPTNGNLIFNPNGVFVYQPNSGFTGEDEFQYQVCDVPAYGAPNCAISTVKILILTTDNTNNSPNATDDAFSNIINKNITGNVATNDYDIDGNTLTTNVVLVQAPSNGLVNIASNGNFTYTPNSNYNGADQFVYEICDNGVPSLCSQATVYIITSEVITNQPPTAIDDNFNTTVNNSLSSSVVNNDFDIDGDNIVLNVTPIENTVNGSISLSTDGSFIYNPTPSFVGVDSFQYEICDDGVPVLCDSAWSFINIQNCPININNIAVTNITDCGVIDGSITISVTGGSGNYEYSIDNGVTFLSSNSFTALASGTYSIAVRDITNACQAFGSTIVIEDKIASIISSVASSSPTNCGIDDGSITIVANSSIGNLIEYSNDGGSTWQSSNVFLGLAGGTYEIRVRNTDGSCIVSDADVVLDTKALPIYNSLTAINPTDCNLDDGMIIIEASKLPIIITPIEYSIDAGNTWQTSDTFKMLPSGNYFIAIRYSDGTCENAYTSNPVQLTSPVAPFIVNTISSNPTNCGLVDGTITIQSTNGIGSYEYSIDSGTTWQTSSVFTGLGGGLYGIRTRNSDGTCIVSDIDITIVDKLLPIIDTVLVQNTSDCGASDGELFIATPIAGIFGYTIDGGLSYRGSNSGGDYFDLPAGTYYIAIINPDSTCAVPYAHNPVIISDPNAPVIDSVSFTNPTNCGLVDGTITIHATGAAMKYSIDGGLTWSLTNVFTGLAGDEYDIAVKNLDGTCIILDTNNPLELVVPTPPIITGVSYTNPTDCNVSNGVIQISAVNGSGSYEYSIDNGATWVLSSVITGLSGGIYTIKVRNVDGTCEVTGQTITIEDKVVPTLVGVGSTDPTNCGTTDGTIVIQANSSNNTVLEYSIDDGSTWTTSNTFIGLSGGIFNIKIRNLGGSCTITAPTTTLTNSIAPTIVNVNANNPTGCGFNDGSIDVTATGQSGLEYSIDAGQSWQASHFFNTLSSGSYYVLVRNGDGSCQELYLNNPVVLSNPNQADTTYLTNTTCNTANAGVFTNVLTNQNGCDSLIITTISLLSNDTTYLNSITCDVNVVGTYTNTLTNQIGCDSVIITNITLSPADTTYLNSTTCDANIVGNYTNVLSNTNGCDSVIITSVSLLLSDTVYTTSTSCDSSVLGIYTNILTNGNGCDSVIINTITYLESDTTYLTATTCDSSNLGTFTNVLSNTNGCDSLII
ncbi:MAG: Ig-like domain-containing protein, partial [Saprospiraceae bacterium]